MTRRSSPSLAVWPDGPDDASDDSPSRLAESVLDHVSRAPAPHGARGIRAAFDGETFAFRRDPNGAPPTALDPRARRSEIACGVAVGRLEAAARAYGHRASVTWRPDDDDPLLLAEARLRPAGRPRTWLLGPLRRGPYHLARDRGPLPSAVLSELRTIADDEGLVLSVATGPDVATVASLTGRASRILLHRASLGRRLAPSALSRVPFLAAALARARDARPIASAPAVALLSSRQDGRNVFLQGGRAFQRIALAATLLGVAVETHPAAIEIALALPGPLDPSLPAREVRDIAWTLRELFGVGEDGRPLLLFRLGRPAGSAERT